VQQKKTNQSLQLHHRSQFQSSCMYIQQNLHPWMEASVKEKNSSIKKLKWQYQNETQHRVLNVPVALLFF
jgi:hypothetical protein